MSTKPATPKAAANKTPAAATPPANPPPDKAPPARKPAATLPGGAGPLRPEGYKPAGKVHVLSESNGVRVVCDDVRVWKEAAE